MFEYIFLKSHIFRKGHSVSIFPIKDQQFMVIINLFLDSSSRTGVNFFLIELGWLGLQNKPTASLRRDKTSSTSVLI